jgi:hypothetical protein
MLNEMLSFLYYSFYYIMVESSRKKALTKEGVSLDARSNKRMSPDVTFLNSVMRLAEGARLL